MPARLRAPTALGRTDMDERKDDEYALDLGWHALNYRCAHTVQAEMF